MSTNDRNLWAEAQIEVTFERQGKKVGDITPAKTFRERISDSIAPAAQGG